ncbi:MAG TPA: lysylphosphatidylglycerol synthase domain-containing protein [Steroidobacteraceae bacterium]|nr:lysylphosphatidylglycerol synthase domain-containing protein [Steroidobacteraceae bacterium]
MRLLLRLGLLAGIVLLIALFNHNGWETVLSPLARAGPVLLWLVPLHAIPVALDVMGWRALLPGYVSFRALLWIALVREAFNRLLPVANVGGEIVGIRMLMRSVPDPGMAAASVVVETLLTLCSQLVFVAIGLVCLMRATDRFAFAASSMAVLAVAAATIGFLAALLRYGAVFERLGRLAQALASRALSDVRIVAHATSLDAAIRRLYTAPGRWLIAGAWQLAGLLSSCAESWLGLRWLGHPVGWPAAIALESLVQAARNFVFFVPAGLGVQELGFVGVGQLLGLDAGTLIALSLAKRLRELILGIPTLTATAAAVRLSG